MPKKSVQVKIELGGVRLKVRAKNTVMEQPREQDAYHWLSGSSSDTGPVRAKNEDALLEWPEAGLWAVADGMGGHANGALASAMVITALQAVEPCENLQAMEKRVVSALTQADRNLKNLAINDSALISGSTAVVLIIVQQMASCIWAGDSRLYHCNDDRFQQITRDHTQAFDFIESGYLTEEEARSHPSSSVLTRVIGGHGPVRLSSKRFPLTLSDRFLLCSDGLSNVLPPNELEKCLRLQSFDECSSLLVRSSLAQGARDNVTAVSVHGR